MDCPKYIQEALCKRAEYANKVFDLDCLIADWLEKNEIEVDPEDIHGGCEIYVNPNDSSKRIYNAIINKEN